ncbi:TPA: hypothetical protein ACPSKI_001016 [Legionella feeleii]
MMSKHQQNAQAIQKSALSVMSAFVPAHQVLNLHSNLLLSLSRLS